MQLMRMNYAPKHSGDHADSENNISYVGTVREQSLSVTNKSTHSLTQSLTRRHSTLCLYWIRWHSFILLIFIARQHAMHAERDIVIANPPVCLSVCLCVYV